MKYLVLCADDYGQNTSISQAIIALLEKKRLSATSCMTTSAHWPIAAKKLEPFKNKADLGLHFNLTEGEPLSKRHQIKGFSSLRNLIIKACLRQINKKTIEAELNAQIDQFYSMMGQLPDFIDGHQHVHQLPVIRDVVLKVYEERLRANGAYIRCVDDPKWIWQWGREAFMKRLVIQLLGAHTFRRRLEKKRIPHNGSFAGFYQFKDAGDYAHFFPGFLSQIQNGGLIMCHPGLKSHAGFDPIEDSRPYEYHYFLSGAFIKDCEKEGVNISRFYECK